MEMYKQASKENLHVFTSKGLLSINQLWTLPLTVLRESIISTKKKINKEETDDELSFLSSSNSVDQTEQLRFNILKDIYLTKQEENEKALELKKRKENNFKIHELIEEKKGELLKSKSIAELEKMLQ